MELVQQILAGEGEEFEILLEAVNSFERDGWGHARECNAPEIFRAAWRAGIKVNFNTGGSK